MSDQPLDLRRSLHLLWRRKFVVAIFAVLGLAAGIGLTMLRPVMLTSNALVVLPQNVHNVATQVVIASSDPVLIGAQRTLGSGGPPQTLRNAIKVKNVTSDIISISAQGKTAAQAERTANAVADSYVAYVNSPSRPGPPVQARILQPALNATATPLSIRLLVNGGLGAPAWPAHRGHRRACDRPQGPAPEGARRDSGFHRGSRPGVDLCRSPIRRRRLGEAS